MQNLSKNLDDLQKKIIQLKKDKNAVILAHFYQDFKVQEVADFIGDSLALSKKAKDTDADIIVFAGVHFMAETASIINPNKKVLLPDLAASCSLAESCPSENFKEFIGNYPDHKVVTYINSSAQVKAMSDIICTSSNALSIVDSFPKEEKIIVAPDKNLGEYIQSKTGRDLVLWDGACHVHEAFSLKKIQIIQANHPDAVILAHPESKEAILSSADFTGSTSAMVNYVRNSDADTFIVATEAGILHQMRSDFPNKEFIPAPIDENNTCACSECEYMKMITLEKILKCLETESPVIKVSEGLRKKALKPLEKMLSFKA
jgi:quinolinate synthase